ncbi:CU044_2847 family protein [Nakamurella endophytica]|uniref:Trypsin-co-occurring domain-containing protein n=1 Tax=Nakamurella endophytica TaxID=1748367 RepID=A0A917SST5_9ACTN|nr:CU044_2847 family protein [Nakamurella endophytica]GGL95916.1 hypothetical protein GCM10011594_14490 [Nakamurella endophytica]
MDGQDAAGSSRDGGHQILVRVVPAVGDRSPAVAGELVERLADRLDDVRAAITDGARTVAQSLTDVPAAAGWELAEVTGSFGLTLTAQAGVILARGSVESTLEVTVTFRRTAAGPGPSTARPATEV